MVLVSETGALSLLFQTRLLETDAVAPMVGCAGIERTSLEATWGFKDPDNTLAECADCNGARMARWYGAYELRAGHAGWPHSMCNGVYTISGIILLAQRPACAKLFSNL